MNMSEGDTYQNPSRDTDLENMIRRALEMPDDTPAEGEEMVEVIFNRATDAEIQAYFESLKAKTDLHETNAESGVQNE